MKKALLLPDSFKGSLSSEKICEIMSDSIKKFFPQCEVISVPVADGGEGSVDCFLTALGGEKIHIEAKDPYFVPMQSCYGLLPDGSAVVETAACAGLPLVEGKKNPALTTTYGVGQQIKHALEGGCKKVIVGLGGSCTNDGGCGAAAALGVQFFDKNGKSFVPVGATLKDIVSIDISKRCSLLNHCEMIAMCDIDNPLCGKNGASAIFAPQKGADEKMVAELEDGLQHLTEIIKKDLNISVESLAGGGAAGGIGAGLYAFCGAKLQSGIKTVLDTIAFESLLENADVVFTGEGKMDSQSLRGKVVIGISERAAAKGVPVIAVVGGADADLSEAYDRGVSAVFTTNRLPLDFSVARKFSEQNLAWTMDNILRLMKLSLH